MVPSLATPAEAGVLTSTNSLRMMAHRNSSETHSTCEPLGSLVGGGTPRSSRGSSCGSGVMPSRLHRSLLYIRSTSNPSAPLGGLPFDKRAPLGHGLDLL